MRTWAMGTWAVALVMAGCMGTSTGNPLDPDVPEPPDDGSDLQGGENTAGDGLGGYCRSEDGVVVAVDGQSELGFTAQDILAFAGGAHEAEIRWNAIEFASYGPEHGTGTITIEVTHGDGEVRYIPPGSGGSDNDTELLAIDGGGCPGQLEIDVDVHIHTAGGALDERLKGTLRSWHPLAASLFVRPDSAKLGGSFAVTEVTHAGFMLAQLDLSTVFSPYGMSGYLNAVFEMRSQGNDGTGGAVTNGVGTSTAGGGALAEWGPAGCDPGRLPLAGDDEVEGVRPADLVAAVNAVASTSIAWKPDGTTTTVALTFAPGIEGGCLDLPGSSGDAPIVSVPGRLTARSEDGRLDADWPGVLEAYLATGSSRRVEFLLDDTAFPFGEDPASGAAAYGVSGLPTGDYDFLNMQLSLAFPLEGDPGVMGELAVRGFVYADCSKPEDAPADDVAAGEDPGSAASDPEAPTTPAAGSPNAGAGGAGGSEATSPGSTGAGTSGCAGATSTDLLVGQIGG